MANKPKIFTKTLLIGAASFMLPALVLGIVYICNGVHPFGDRQIIVTDFWHQYYPFLCELQEKLKAGESLFFSENIGLGINFWALIAYYCASPLNILTIFVSKEGLRDMLTFIVILKVGFSGLFFSMYLKKVFSRCDFTIVAFSSLYALCGYVLGYYWNIMWLDCVSLLPLVMLGVYLIIKENKYLLYTISLAICVMSNFYIGFMVCIFTAIYFFAESIRVKLKISDFFRKLGIIAAASAVGLALTAFITLPAYNALGNTVSSVPKAENNETVTEKLLDGAEEFCKDTPEILGRTLSFNEPVPKDGLPNIFSGFICVILFGYFLCLKNIKLREKLVTSAVLLLLLISMAVTDIDIIWHGMHKPNMVPYRYAFVFSFMMVTMAYRAFTAIETSTEKIKKGATITSIAISAIVIVCAINEDVIDSVKALITDGEPIMESLVATILGSIAIAIIYHLMLSSFCTEEGAGKTGWCKALCGVIVAEVVINTVIAVPTVRTTDYTTYYYRGEEIENLLEKVDADNSHQRVENAQEYILNDPALYGFKGVSAFSSTANHNVTKLMEKMALCAPPRANRYYYETTSPLTNAFLGIEHVIFRNGMKNLNPYLTFVEAEYDEHDKEQAAIYKNEQTLPIGFMADGELLDESLEGKNPFEVQNDLFKKATGLEGDLFTRVDVFSVMSTNTVRMKGADGEYSLTLDEGSSEYKMDVNYVVPDSNSIYAYINGEKITSVAIDNTTYKAVKRKYIFPAGKYEAGEKVTFKFKFESTFKKSGSIQFHVYSMNEALFEEGMALLRDEPLEFEVYESTFIKGNINATQNGCFYTSIPYEKGWKLYVDGVEEEIVPFENAFIATYLEKGEHEIVLKYTPNGFVPGVMISIFGVIMLSGMIVLEIIRRRKKNGQNIDSSTLLQ